jgi:hypothetical protein
LELLLRIPEAPGLNLGTQNGYMVFSSHSRLLTGQYMKLGPIYLAEMAFIQAAGNEAGNPVYHITERTLSKIS